MKLNTFIIVFIVLMAKLSLAQTSHSYHIDNTVRIDRTNCSSLSQLSVLIPYPTTDQYQTISDETYLGGQLLSIPNTPNNYVRFLYTSEQLSNFGNIIDVTISFNAILHPFNFDFSQIGTIYPYNTSSNEYQQNTGASDVYILPNHPTINSIAQSLWSVSSDIVDYARRCYEYVAENYNYLNPNTGLHPLDELLTNGGGDCGNLSSIYISLLRNKSIPSRHVVTIRPDGSHHVWAEYYLENYGWIPVDVTYKQSNPNGDYFGIYDGNGIIVSKGICLTLEKEPSNSYQCVLFQTFDWWYWYYNSYLCNGITSQQIINSENQFYYYVSTQSSDVSLGETFGDGLYITGGYASVFAQPYENCLFVNWTENGSQVSTNANYTFIVTDNRTLVAHFQPQSYTITASANPTDGGTVSGGGTYNHGESCTLTATPNSGYVFVNWTKNGTQVSTNESYTFTVTESASFVAHFQAQSYTITVSADPTEGGITFGGGTYTYGQSCSIQASSNSGYNFMNWTENGTQVSTNANYSFTVTGNRNLVANFEAQPQQYTISVSVNPSNGGNVSGGGIYNQGQSCTVHATANSGYTFINWTENGTQVSTNPNYTFTVTGNRNLVANFQAQTQQYTVSVSANPSNGGNVAGGGTYNQGQSCTVSATANSGFTFVNWTENGTQVSTNANYTFTVTGNRNLVAHFTTQSFVITAIADPTAGGVVTGSGGYNYGETCTLTATPNAGYTFQRWTKNGTQVSTNPTYSFTVTESATYTAHFNAQSYTITVAANPNNAGSVSGGGSYTYGQTCTVNASANNSYAFTNWTENGTQVSTNSNYSFTVTGSRNLVANFAQNTHTIQASAGANGIITPSDTVTVAHGANQSFSMIPDSDYEVHEVYIDGNPVGAISSYTFSNVIADHNIHVTFVHVDAVAENNTNSISIYPNPTKGGITVEGEGMSHIRVVNVYGQIIYETEVNDNQVHIDLSGMAKGIYLMHIEANGSQTVRKIVVE